MSSSKVKFSIEIEKLKEMSPDISFIEILTEYCELKEIDLELVPKLLTESLLQKIARESKDMKLVEDFSEASNMDEIL